MASKQTVFLLFGFMTLYVTADPQLRELIRSVAYCSPSRGTDLESVRHSIAELKQYNRDADMEPMWRRIEEELLNWEAEAEADESEQPNTVGKEMENPTPVHAPELESDPVAPEETQCVSTGEKKEDGCIKNPANESAPFSAPFMPVFLAVGSFLGHVQQLPQSKSKSCS
ncbi:uncharacterized protein LOC130168930 isoform X3 [Seriola aureovittata]|nr:uncharacterized protein LOC130168930 isoform X3 [Seriola aureovittata]